MRVYLAGPLGFSEVGGHFQYNVLLPKLNKLGHELIDPWKLADAKALDNVRTLPFGSKRRDAWTKLSAQIGEMNAAE